MKWLVRFVLWRGGVMEEDNFPLSIPFKENIRFLVVFVGDLSALQLGPDMNHVAGNGGVAAGADLDMHVTQPDLLHAIPFPNIFRPLFLIRGQIGAPFGQILRKIVGVKRKILRQVVGFIRGVRTLLEVAHFLFWRRRTGSAPDRNKECGGDEQNTACNNSFVVHKKSPVNHYLTINP